MRSYPLSERKFAGGCLEHQDSTGCRASLRCTLDNDFFGTHQLNDRAVGHGSDDALFDLLFESRIAVVFDWNSVYPKHLHSFSG